MGRPIDEEKIIDIVVYECGEWSGLAKEIEKQIRALPTAEPQIIRCKDCVHSEFVDGWVTRWCDYWDDRTEVDGYCSYAERMEDET